MLRGNTRRKTNNIQSGIESQSCVWRDTHDPVRVALSLVWPSMGIVFTGEKWVSGEGAACLWLWGAGGLR